MGAVPTAVTLRLLSVLPVSPFRLAQGIRF